MEAARKVRAHRARALVGVSTAPAALGPDELANMLTWQQHMDSIADLLEHEAETRNQKPSAQHDALGKIPKPEEESAHDTVLFDHLR